MPHFKILIIDDEEQVRRTIQRTLSRAGYVCLVAGSGPEGLRLIREENPSLILCDIHMSGMDGFQVLKAMQEDPETSRIPFMFLTGADRPEDFRRGMSTGADDYLTKPVATVELLEAVETRLRRWESLQQSYHRELEQTRSRIEMRQQACPVTGLPNMAALETLYPELMEKGSRQEGRLVLLIRLDRLNGIREAFGRSGAEQVVRLVAERLLKHLPEGSLLCRTEIDRLLLIRPEPVTPEQAEELMGELLETIRPPILLGRNSLRLNLSLGCYLGGKEILPLPEVLDRVETAADMVHGRGGGGFQFYSVGLTHRALRRLELESDLGRALEEEQFQLHYQPLLDAGNLTILSAEALVRWAHPTSGLIPPLQFLGIAEESGQISALGSWVLREACREVLRWEHRTGISIRVGVNVSGRQFEDGGLPRLVADTLEATGLPGSRLELEITESVLVKDRSSAIRQLEQLKELGVLIAVDDFGTGYSSLSYLRRFPLDILKIDRAFVKDVAVAPQAAAIVASVVEMGHSLGLHVIAEGVETEEQLHRLEQLGPDGYQGYLFSRPVPPSEMARLLEGPSIFPASSAVG